MGFTRVLVSRDIGILFGFVCVKHDVRIIWMAGNNSDTSSLRRHHDRWSDVDVSLYYEYTTVCCSIVCTIGNKELPEEVSARRKKYNSLIL